MTNATFEKVRHSDTPLYGPEKLILCGFPSAAKDKMTRVMEMAGIPDVPVVWADVSHQGRTLAELFSFSPVQSIAADGGIPLPRAVVVSGITENQLHALMAVCRQTGMQQALWATLTPTSEQWTLGALLKELAAERDALIRHKNAGQIP